MTRIPTGGLPGVRVSVELPGVDAAAARTGAVAAEQNGLECVWIRCADDVYTMTTLSAIAADTRDIRLGAILDLQGPATVIRLAEMIGLVDQLSAGRLELALIAGRDDQWLQDARALLSARYGWPLPDGRRLPVTPRPVQPSIPVLLIPRLAGTEDAAHDLRAGLLREADTPPAPTDARVVVRTTTPGSRPQEQVSALRALITAHSAAEIIFTAESTEQIRYAGTVLATGIRANEHEARFLTELASEWSG